ncbi:phenylalanine--tRNA ligase subunit alpha [Malacoplasma iowae]|uniref:phenylalanine--tRNA ligase subunit alpha n=1 Tax=Malacoplasma iowae TaxID=2116 RepID=UPI003873B7E0|nr:phenylalanine--tRNA ligase subunit alpha [Malacoplasma iowae]
MENYNKLIDEFKLIISNINNEKELIDTKNIFNKNHISKLYDQLKSAPIELKKEIGQKINDVKSRIDNLFEEKLEFIRNASLNDIKSKYDVMLPSDYMKSGSFNPIELVANDILRFFKDLSFDIVTDNEVTSVDYNFDKLNFKDDHPARSLSDTFFINEKLLLRVHCTSVTSMYLEKNKSEQEIKVVSYGNVYRKDDDDATHSHQFNQIDLVWVKKGLSISNLKWLINELMKYLFNKDTKTRYRLSYFPFTEPSMEVDISCFMCNGDGCNVCKKTGWIEILGSGLLHPNVLKAAKVNPELNAIAAGLGLDRIAMIKYGISDIRDIYMNDFNLIKQFRGKR